jgi:hypothetical protein
MSDATAPSTQTLCGVSIQMATRGTAATKEAIEGVVWRASIERMGRRGIMLN